MKRKTTVISRRPILCMLVIAIVLSLFTALRINVVHAASTKAPSCAKSQTIYVDRIKFKGDPQYHDNGVRYDLARATSRVYIKNLSNSAKITDIRFASSTPYSIQYSGYEKKVNSTTRYIDIFNRTISSYIGNGSTDVLYVTVQKGKKTYHLSCNLTFRYESVLSSFKIGSKNLSSYAKKYNEFYVKRPTLKSGKLSMQFNKNYQFLNLKEVRVAYKNNDGSYTSKPYKNGNTITNIKRIDTIRFTYIPKKARLPKSFTPQSKLVKDMEVSEDYVIHFY